MPQSPKVFPVSLGCPKNRVDLEKTLSVLKSLGYEVTFDPLEAHLLWVNTCAFIKPAVEEAIDTILELSEYKKNGAKLVVSGCLTARYGREKLKELLPEVDEFHGIEAYKELTKEQREESEPTSRVLTESPFYAYLKISEGCAHRCSYCTIPTIRGIYRSKPQALLLFEARKLLEAGIKELILVGQDITLYGRDQNEKDGLVRLLESLSSLPYEFRIRLLYLHPQQADGGLITNILSLPKVVPYFELPIQHAHQAVLKAMKRAYTAEKILRLIEFIRSKNFFSTIRSTVMVGFPGEGEREFSYLLDFLKEAKFDYLGVFPFYLEEETPAKNLKPRVGYKEKMRRKGEVLHLQRIITQERLRARVGLIDEVLVLDEGGRKLKGIATFQAPEIDGVTLIKVRKEKAVCPMPGELVKVQIVEAKTYDVIAELSSSLS